MGQHAQFRVRREVLIARTGEDVAEQVEALDAARARAIGRAARRRVLAEHTYMHRAAQVERVLDALVAAPAGEPPR